MDKIDINKPKEITHNPIFIANHFIKKKYHDMTILRLLKLCYIAHGFKLAFLDEPFSNEPVEAWKYGPVFPTVYDVYRWDFPKPIIEINKSTTEMFQKERKSSFSKNEISILDKVFKIFAMVSTAKLVSFTHKIGGAWDIVYNEQKGYEKDHAIIPNEIIKTEFKKYLNNT